MTIGTYDTVIIGGGMSGMVCALLQARKGRKVVIVEKGPHLAPTLWGFERKGTYLDTGFHYAGSMGTEGLLSYLLQALDLDEELEEQMKTVEIYDRVRFQKAGFDVRFAQGWEALEAELVGAFPDESAGIASFLQEIRSLWEEGRAAFKENQGRSLGPLFSKEGRSLEEAVSKVTENPYLQAVLSCHAILYGAPASVTSLMYHSQVVGSYYESSSACRGGGRRWIEVFTRALEQAGVEFRCGHGVKQICLDEAGHCTGVALTDGSTLLADHCICSVHPKTMLTLLPDKTFRPAYCRRINELEETSSAVVLFGRGTAPDFCGNLLLLDDPQSMGDWQTRPFEERPLFVSAPEGLDSGGVSIICPATLADVPDLEQHEGGTRPASYRAWKQDVADRLIKRLVEHAGDVVRDFELLAIASPLTFQDWVGSPEGGIYGVQHRQEDMPLLPQTRVPGLYLSGQAIVAPGVLGALCAGFLTESCVA